MQIRIAVRHGQLAEATQAKISERVEKLSKYFERLTFIDVTVDLSHSDSPSVELRVDSEHKHDFVATETGGELFAALEECMHKMEQQIRKYKERIQDHHRGEGRRVAPAAGSEAGGE